MHGVQRVRTDMSRAIALQADIVARPVTWRPTGPLTPPRHRLRQLAATDFEGCRLLHAGLDLAANLP